RFLSIYMLNPMAVLMDTIRNAALRGEPPMWNYLLYSVLVSILFLVIGYRVFKKLEPLFAETI
ncbi:MAG: ABC transporter permease, partial [Armatimonadota bacterium]